MLKDKSFLNKEIDKSSTRILVEMQICSNKNNNQQKIAGMEHLVINKILGDQDKEN